jgi:amino acid adenylation domain-containing protein
MKSAETIVAELATRDIQLHVEDGRLRVNAPRGALTPELRDILAARKDDLVALLRDARPAAAASASIPRHPRTAPLPMSFGQQRMWFVTRMAPARALFNLPMLYRIEGPLDTGAMQRSLAEIVNRHEVLRTTLAMEGETPVQSVHPPFQPCASVEDATGEPGTRDEVVARLVAAELARPFDLEATPPFRARLIRLGADDHLLLLVLHHSAGDFWSMGVLQRELVALFTAFSAGQPSPLADLPIQYGDFAAWQRAALDAGTVERGFAYWRKQLAGLEPALELPTDHPRPAVQTTAGAIAFKPLSPELFQRLRRLGTQYRVTRFMTLLAVWAYVLSRYTGRSDLAIGTPVANRGRRELEDLIGFFVNSLALRLQVNPRATFAELLAHARQITLDAYAHQELPFEQLVEELRPPRDLSRHPLFQVDFVVHAESRGGMNLPGLNVTPALPSESRGVALDLSLEVTDDERRPVAVLIYSTDLFEASTANRLLAYYELVLEAIAANPAINLADLPAMLPEDAARLEHWNATARPLPEARTLPEMFAGQARRTPDRVAVIAGDDRLTYAELDARSTAFAHRLRQIGFRPGALAGVYMERTAALLPTLLGIHKAGGAYVPLDPAFPRDRIAYMLEDSSAAVLIVDKASRPTAPSFAGPIVSVNDQERPGAPAPLDFAPPSGEDLAYVIYTSGSTGRPKGVQIPHRALLNFLDAMRERPGLTKDDRLVAVTTLSFDIAGLELFLPITTGAAVVLARRDAAADPARLMALMAETDATVMQATPATWRMLIEAGWQGSPNMRVFCGGEAMPEEIGRGLVARAAEVWNLYGPTETTIWSTVDRLGPDGRATIGAPIANTRIYVLDAALRPVPVGAAGEIFIGGEGVARGYLNRPELTAERFLPDPSGFTADARMYRTGDLGRFGPDGRLHYLGRADHQVKLRGFRIELGEIESVLSAHPAVAQAVALVREDSPGDPRLVAYIVPSEKGSDPSADLKQAVIETLPQYMRPTAYVMLEALPLTPNGKVDRRALPAPERGGTREYVGPRNPIEEAIAETWQTVFKLERVGVEDDFFELGGHSLMAIQVLSRVRDQFEIDVPLVTLFESPTVAGLSLAIMERLLAAEDATPA